KLWLTAGIVLSLVATSLLAWRTLLRRESFSIEQPPEPLPTSVLPTTPPEQDGIPIRFEDIARQTGIDFVHQDGKTPMNYFPEAMGAGVAWLDYDQDGYIDLLFVQGGRFPPNPRQPVVMPRTKLYRNKGNGSFVDVTQQVGLAHADYGQGVAVGDYDNDG